MKTSSDKKGSLLIIVMIMMTAFGLMLAALLQTGAFSRKETIMNLRSEQARWTAEAGLEKVLSMVMMPGSSYRDTVGSIPSVETGTIAAKTYTGRYTVYVTKDPLSLGNEYKLFTITSIGIVSNRAMTAEATAQISMITAPGGQQALLALGGSSTIDNGKGIIDGTIYQAPPGTLSIGNNVTVTDIVEAEGGIIGPGADDVTVGNLPDPDPGPIVDPDETPKDASSGDHYTDWLAIAASTNTAHTFQGDYGDNPGETFDLASAPDNSIYVNGNVYIRGNITGSGKVVANGTVSFDSNNKSINNDVTILAKSDVSVTAGNISFGENVILVTEGNFTLDGNQNYPYPGTSIIAIKDPETSPFGNVTIGANTKEFKGVIYADGKVTIASGGQVIRGTIIAWEGFDIGANAIITYDPSVFTEPSPVDYGAITLLSSSWSSTNNIIQ